jgi:hypothetical protein
MQSAGAAGSQLGAGAKPASAGTGARGEAGQGTSSQVELGHPGAGSGGAASSAVEPGMADGNQAEAADCDLNGVWIARQITVSEAIGVSAFSNNWYYLELKQNGTAAEVTKHFDCGIEVLGAVTVVLERPALEAQLSHNLQTGRKLSMSKDGATCRLESGRFWSIRGADEMRYLPGGARDSGSNIREVAMSLPLPTADNPDGALDPDGDGVLGLAFEISGLLSGTRNSVQRDWTRWFTEPGYELPPSMDWTSDLTIRADFDNEESVLAPRDSLLSSGSTPKGSAKHTLRLRFLGRNVSDPRVAAIMKGSQVDTCYAIQDALPAEELQ